MVTYIPQMPINQKEKKKWIKMIEENTETYAGYTINGVNVVAFDGAYADEDEIFFKSGNGEGFQVNWENVYSIDFAPQNIIDKII